MKSDRNQNLLGKLESKTYQNINKNPRHRSYRTVTIDSPCEFSAHFFVECLEFCLAELI